MNDVREQLRAATRRLPPSDPAAAVERLAAAAAAAGLLDVAVGVLESPVGRLLGAVTGRGLVALDYLGPATAPLLAELAHRVSPRVLWRPQALSAVGEELDEYFGGRRRAFTLVLDRRLLRGFQAEVLAATEAIPYGTVRTYQEVAAAAGRPRASRAAGNALAANPLPIVIPCHRVVRTGGGLGGYGGGVDRKVRLLAREGWGGRWPVPARPGRQRPAST
ncbi:MAG TPA: methylated-DNA--[protein]-cysteine S-methyltransferase [Candidatus Dormibacteraeota bacterium]|nr:methylated-DNA--[protein]-cysteine S-methyltransferase [Candidatus Dormibacteraeota bacterium]